MGESNIAPALRSAVIAGGAAGNLTVTGIKTTDKLSRVIAIPMSSGLLTELHADHATFKTAVDEGKTLIDEMFDDEEAKRDYLAYLNERDGVISGDHSFTAGTAATLTGAGRVTSRIGGGAYSANVDTTITLVDNGDITQNKFRAWRILQAKDGTITTQDAGSGATGLNADNAEDALLSLAQNPITADTVEIGYITITDSDSVFDIGTTNLDASGVTVRTFVVTGPRLGAGLSATLGGAGFATDAGVATWDSGTIDARVEGGEISGAVFSRDLAQIGAITDQAMDDADTVDINDFGGWLLVTNLAGTGVYALAADGVAGAVSAMTYTTAALRNTALDDVQAALPAIFAPLGRILLENVGGGNAWVAGTDAWDHDTAVTTVTNYTFGSFARATVNGSVGTDAPAIPAVLTASKPTAGPATLGAALPAQAAPVDLTSEFSITAADTINNAGGSSSANGFLLVLYFAAGASGGDLNRT